MSQEEPPKCLVCPKSFAQHEHAHTPVLMHSDVQTGSSSLLSFDPQATHHVSCRQMCPHSPPSRGISRNCPTDARVAPECFGRPFTVEINSSQCNERNEAECADNLTRRLFPSCDVFNISDLGKGCQQNGLASDDEITSSKGSETNSNDDNVDKPVTNLEFGDRDSGVDEDEMIDVESCWLPDNGRWMGAMFRLSISCIP